MRTDRKQLCKKKVGVIFRKRSWCKFSTSSMLLLFDSTKKIKLTMLANNISDVSPKRLWHLQWKPIATLLLAVRLKYSFIYFSCFSLTASSSVAIIFHWRCHDFFAKCLKSCSQFFVFMFLLNLTKKNMFMLLHIIQNFLFCHFI